MSSRSFHGLTGSAQVESPSDGLDDHALEQVGQAFVAVWCQAQEKVAGHRPRSQLRAMEAIADNPGISVRELSRKLGAVPSAVSRLCDRLVVASLLERAPADTDRRQVALRLTAEGAQLLRDIAQQRRADLTAVLERMPAEERAQLMRSLAAFAAHARTP